jgi:hypothetical protein
VGRSAATVTDAVATFQSRYAAFRAELGPREQEWFDELVCAPRRHSNAIDRRPHLDFERPVALAMLMEAMRHLDAAHARDDRLHEDLRKVQHALADASLALRRPPAPDALCHRPVGQARPHDHEAVRPVPA